MKTVMLKLPDSIYALANQAAKTREQSVESVLQTMIAVALQPLDNFKFDYLADNRGQLKGVMIPPELWQQLFSEEPTSVEAFIEGIENYCLNEAMNEAKETALLSKDEAIAYLSE